MSPLHVPSRMSKCLSVSAIAEKFGSTTAFSIKLEKYLAEIFEEKEERKREYKNARDSSDDENKYDRNDRVEKNVYVVNIENNGIDGHNGNNEKGGLGYDDDFNVIDYHALMKMKKQQKKLLSLKTGSKRMSGNNFESEESIVSSNLHDLGIDGGSDVSSSSDGSVDGDIDSNGDKNDMNTDSNSSSVDTDRNNTTASSSPFPSTPTAPLDFTDDYELLQEYARVGAPRGKQHIAAAPLSELFAKFQK